MERITFSSGAKWEPIFGYSRATKIGNNVFISGTVAIYDGQVVGPDDPYAQSVFILNSIEKALKDAGAELRHVYRTRVFVTNVKDWEEIARAHGSTFKDILPCCTLVGVKELINPELVVEIEADALIHD